MTTKPNLTSTNPEAIKLALELGALSEKTSAAIHIIMQAAERKIAELSAAATADQDVILTQLTQVLDFDEQRLGHIRDWNIGSANLKGEEGPASVTLIHDDNLDEYLAMRRVAEGGKDDCDCMACQIRRASDDYPSTGSDKPTVH